MSKLKKIVSSSKVPKSEKESLISGKCEPKNQTKILYKPSNI